MKTDLLQLVLSCSVSINYFLQKQNFTPLVLAFKALYPNAELISPVEIKASSKRSISKQIVIPVIPNSLSVLLNSK
jgi:hypothetical protein